MNKNLLAVAALATALTTGALIGAVAKDAITPEAQAAQGKAFTLAVDDTTAIKNVTVVPDPCLRTTPATDAGPSQCVPGVRVEVFACAVSAPDGGPRLEDCSRETFIAEPDGPAMRLLTKALNHWKQARGY